MVNTMRVFSSPTAVEHDPEVFFRRGKLVPHPEQIARHVVLRDAVTGAGHDVVAPRNAGLDAIHAIHEDGYVAFLRLAWSRRDELPDIGDEIVTGHFARLQMHRRPDGLLGLIGYYTADTSTPIRRGTWEAVYGSAQSAIGAADFALESGCAYALCRPPGHHAFRNSAGGFCYLNNTAIAAERLRAALGGCVAILDIDVHHGNGTQGIFYDRSDVLTVSVHADPHDYFPFFAGYPDETGFGPGEGFNLNLPVPPGSGDDVWLYAIRHGLTFIAGQRPSALVIALGLDAGAEDPLGVLNVTRDGFAQAARDVARLNVPTAIVQEGGYLCAALPHNLLAFLQAFDEVRG